MRAIKIGDTLMSQGTVVGLDVGRGMYRITSPTGSHRWVHECNYQLVEPPPFNEGDRVTIIATNRTGVIEQIDDLPYRIAGEGWYDASQLKPAPPKPEYHVVRKDDTIGVQRIESDMPPIWLGRVYMSDPEVVETAIVEWATVYRIDADAARELAAEPQIIGRHEIHGTAYATAIRHGGGWSVYVTAINWQNVDSVTRNGTLQPKHIGEAIFRKVEGPYEVKP